MGAIDWNIVDQLEYVELRRGSSTEELRLLATLLDKAKRGKLSDADGSLLRTSYERALATTFPAANAVQRWHCEFHGVTSDPSVQAMQPARLRKLEVAAHDDPILSALLAQFTTRLAGAKQVEDSQIFRQAFEEYAEVVVYALLSEHFPTRRLDDPSVSLPDFQCEAMSGKPFYVELKAFDMVDAPHRSKAFLADGVDQNTELERQKAAGASVAIAAREIAPYKPAFGTNYDPRSLARVIDVLRSKARSAFKSSQFEQGPTFAFAVCDRLLIPAGKRDLAPYFGDRDGSLSSGVLWNACFGRAGSPVLRFVDPGHATIEGHLTADGLMVDLAVPFPTGGIVFAETTWNDDNILGLYDQDWSVGDWDGDDTLSVMSSLCTAFNDKSNAWATEVG